MTKVVAAAALAAVVLVVAAGTAAAVEPQTQTFTAVQVSEQHPSSKAIVVKDKDVAGGKVVGHDTLSCTIGAKQVVSCKVTVERADGTYLLGFKTRFDATHGQGNVLGGT